MDAETPRGGVTRRSLLSGGAIGAASLAGEALAQQKPPAKPAARPAAPPRPAAAVPTAPPINCAVIGLGIQGRELIASLSRVAGANVAAICDTYEPFLRRAGEGAPKAAGVKDYRAVLDRKDVPAVFVATPTHLHREIVTAALQAGKHVYCESPMAHTLEEARAIARAGSAAAAGGRQFFQVGQQYRDNPQHHHVEKFIRTGVLNRYVGGRGQWHRKSSWRRAAPTSERERAINWRLDPALSAGLLGEVGIHGLDVANWFLKKLPVAVSGWSAIRVWTEDGRKVADTAQCTLEYDDGSRYSYSATLGNSFEGSYELFFGSDSAVLLRDERAWMFKESDAPLLGWEVYARKEEWGDDTGIALVADASKQLKEGKMPGKEKQVRDPGKTALFFAVESFLNICRGIGEKKQPDCGAREGYQAAVTAIKANEAAVAGGRVVFQKEWFSL
jgi:predicted dehydrogenase